MLRTFFNDCWKYDTHGYDTRENLYLNVHDWEGLKMKVGGGGGGGGGGGKLDQTELIWHSQIHAL